MSDSDNTDQWDRLASSKFASQADLSDDDSIFAKRSAPRATKSANVVAKRRAAESDDDLDLLAAEIENRAPDNAQIVKLRLEIAKWETLRGKAQQQNADPTKIARLTKKIQSLQLEIQSLSAPAPLTIKQEKEIARVERDIATLELERGELNARIAALESRLAVLKPHSAKADWLNDPQQLGGKIVGGKFVEDRDSGDDDYTQLSKMMTARRQLAQTAGQYNSSSGHVKITAPKHTRDNNPGF